MSRRDIFTLVYQSIIMLWFMDAGLDRSGTSSKEKRLHLANHQKDLMNAANHFCINRVSFLIYIVKPCVVDPDPKEPYVYGPPGYGSVIVRIRVLPSTSEKSDTNLYCYYFWNSFFLFVFEDRCKCTDLKKVISKKTVFKGWTGFRIWIRMDPH